MQEAARIIDQLENAGVVSPPNGSKPRQVMVSDARCFYGKYELIVFLIFLYISTFKLSQPKMIYFD